MEHKGRPVLHRLLHKNWATEKKIINFDKLWCLNFQKGIRYNKTSSERLTLTACLFNMKEKTHLLKGFRLEANFVQQDVATLLNMPSSNLNRYEKEKHKPTPEIILTYHILFDAPLKMLFHPLYMKVKANIIQRSQKLIAQLEIEQTPKSKQRVAYLRSIVKQLSTEQENE